jgi:mannose-1-phosphate guanylyltransferase
VRHPVFLLAAGLGTRLRPLTDLLPKPLLPIGDRPALAHVIDRVRSLGGPLVVNAHHLVEDLRAFLMSYAPDALLSVEHELLGTAGGLARAGAMLGDGAVLVWNGDILAELEVARLIEAHTLDKGALATLAVESLPFGQGNVGTDEAMRVVRLRTETVLPGEVRGGLFLGIHVVGPELRSQLPEKGCLVGDVYLPSLRTGETVLRAFDVGDTPWQDIGTLADYRVANLAWLARRGLEAFVGEGASVAPGVRLERTLVGAGARIEGEGAVIRSVVWPGVRTTAPLVDQIVTDSAAFSLGLRGMADEPQGMADEPAGDG